MQKKSKSCHQSYSMTLKCLLFVSTTYCYVPASGTQKFISSQSNVAGVTIYLELPFKYSKSIAVSHKYQHMMQHMFLLTNAFAKNIQYETVPIHAQDSLLSN